MRQLRPIKDTELVMVDDAEKLKMLRDELNSVSKFAVDLEVSCCCSVNHFYVFLSTMNERDGPSPPVSTFFLSISSSPWNLSTDLWENAAIVFCPCLKVVVVFLFHQWHVN